MADEHQELTKAFSGLGGLGVEETALVSALGRWRKQPEKRSQFRQGFPGFFTPSAAGGGGTIERCSDEYVKHLKTEFSRFKNLMVLWAMHPWERDARWAHRALHKKHHPAAVLVELACTRTADELLGARRAYHALYHRSLEEGRRLPPQGQGGPPPRRPRRCLPLRGSTRQRGPRQGGGHTALAAAGAKPQSELVVRVLATRSKPQLRATFRMYEKISGQAARGGVRRRGAVHAGGREVPRLAAKYFADLIVEAFKEGADKQAKAALTRVVVSRSDADMEEIKEAYLKQHGTKLVDTVAKNTPRPLQGGAACHDRQVIHPSKLISHSHVHHLFACLN
ncbi:hypothetical protein ACQ4PT_048052 [Festuca glaucescens]